MKILLKPKNVILLFLGAFVNIFTGILYAQDLHASFPEEFSLASLNSTNGFFINGISPGDYSSYPVKELGDINGDGINDFIIGSATAKSIVVFGSEQKRPIVFNLNILDGTNGFIIKGAGFSVNAAGDLNGDGIADVVVSDPKANNLEGITYVIFGNKQWRLYVDIINNLNGKNGFKINGVNPGDNSGWSISPAGDFNNDGIDDLLIGAPHANNGAGQCYVVFGSQEPWPSMINLVNLIGPNGFAIDAPLHSLEGIGATISNAGDVNKDGIKDILIGTLTGGNSYLLLGHANPWPLSINLDSLNGTNGCVLNRIAGLSSSSIVSGAGDIDGDGFDDFLTASPRASNTAGQTSLVFGRKEWPAALNLSNLNGNDGVTINGGRPGDYSGSSVSGAGNFNNDNFTDFLVSAYGANNFTGQISVFYGGKKPWPPIINHTSLNGVNGFNIDGFYSANLSAISVAGGSDYNGDGVADIIIGTHDYNNNVGQSYAIYGCCPAIIPAYDNGLILGLSLGLSGGILFIGGSVSAYFLYQHYSNNPETQALSEVTEHQPDYGIGTNDKLNFLNHHQSTPSSTSQQ